MQENSAQRPMCGRCHRDLPTAEAEIETWNAVYRKGRVVQILCPDCQTPEENAEASDNLASGRTDQSWAVHLGDWNPTLEDEALLNLTIAVVAARDRGQADPALESDWTSLTPAGRERGLSLASKYMALINGLDRTELEELRNIAHAATPEEIRNYNVATPNERPAVRRQIRERVERENGTA